MHPPVWVGQSVVQVQVPRSEPTALQQDGSMSGSVDTLEVSYGRLYEQLPGASWLEGLYIKFEGEVLTTAMLGGGGHNPAGGRLGMIGGR